jgi:hypothetical protein
VLIDDPNSLCTQESGQLLTKRSEAESEVGPLGCTPFGQVMTRGAGGSPPPLRYGSFKPVRVFHWRLIHSTSCKPPQLAFVTGLRS